MLKRTSEETTDYNCAAWALGANDFILWPGEAWTTSGKIGTIEDFVAEYRARGFVECEPGSPEPGSVRIVLYARNGFFMHAARQLPDGAWTSKLGAHEMDAEHPNVECLCGPGYGQVHCYMKRPEKPPEGDALRQVPTSGMI